MNRQANILLAVVAVALLGGCDSEPARSVEWYLANPAERKAKVEECSSKAELQADASGNCARARQAGLMDKPSRKPL